MEERSLSKGGLLKAVFCVICSILLAVTLMPSGAYAASADTAVTDAAGDQDVSLLADDEEPSVWNESVDISWYDPDGTEFTLTSAAQLAGLAAISTGKASGTALDNFKDKTVYLGVDMDLANISWDPISDFIVTSTATWQGTLDGKGHIITNMNVEASDAEQFGGVRGLIAGIGAGGVVRNLGVQGSVAGRVCGGIVGATNEFSATDTNTLAINEWPRIENCWTNVTVSGNGSGRRGSGGIFGGDSNSTGNMYCNIINCYSTGSVSAAGGIPVGGLAGVNGAIVAGSYSTASITGEYVGGNVATMYMKGYDSGSYNFTAQGTYVNNMTTTSPAYRYYSGSSGDGGTPATSNEGYCTSDELADNGVSTLGEHAWVKDTTAPYYPQLYWEAGYSDINISEAAVVTVNDDNTVTVTVGDDTLVEYTDYFAVGEGASTVVYGIGRYTGEAKPGQGGISTWDGTIDTSWYDASKTEFTLYSAAQLAALADITSPDCSKVESNEDTKAVVGVTDSRAEGIKLDNFEGKTVKLAVDVNLADIRWDPISDINVWGHGSADETDDISGTFTDVYWQGTFDGGGHVVVGLDVDGNVNCSKNYNGYQGFISGIGVGGLVRNLGVSGSIHGRVNGGIVGASNFDTGNTGGNIAVELNEWPRIENCWTNVSINSSGSGSRASGGIFGGERDYRAMCNIINCYSQGSLSRSSAAQLGGISGQTNGIVAGCYSTSTSSDLAASVTTNLFVPAYSSDTYKAIGVFEHNIGLKDPVYRYSDTWEDYDHSKEAAYAASSTDDLKNGVSTLGNHAWVEGTGTTGYPQLYWEAGESDADLSDAEVTVADDGTVTVTLGTDELIEYTDYFVVTDDLVTTVYGVGRYTGSAQYEAEAYFTVNVQVAGSDEEATVAKKFSKESFEALVPEDSKDKPVSGMYGTGSWSVASTDYYVTLSDIYESAGINEEDVDELSLESLDGSVTLSADDLENNKWFYPNATNDESSSAEGAIEVPAVFALTSYSSEIGENQTAADVQAYNLGKADDENAPRFINGISESQFEAKSAVGRRLWSNCSSITVTVGGISLQGADVTVATGDYVYTGSAITPDVSVTLNGNTLTAGTDYTVAYSNNINAGDEATVTVTGTGQYTDSASATFTISPADIADCTIGAISDVKATGKELEPELTINDNRFAGLGQAGPKLVLGTDYTAEYTNNEKIGSTATVTVTGMGNYTGTTTTTFNIIPYFTVYYQVGGDEYDKEGEEGEEGVREAVREYDQNDFESLADAEHTYPVSGLMYQGDGWHVTTTDYYVTLEALFSDAELEWDKGTVLSYGGEGTSISDSYESITAQDLFFPDAAGTTSFNPGNSEESAPAVLSIQEYSCATGTDEIPTAEDAEKYNIAYIGDHKTDGLARANEPRMVYGITQDDYLSQSAMGRRYWSRCDHVTLNVPGYDITVDQTENGTATVDKEVAAFGDDITITATPDDGYVVDNVSVKDADGNEVTVTDSGNNTYTFRMPESNVTVDVTFVESEPAKITITKDMFEVDTSYGIYDGKNPVTKTITSDLKEGTDYIVTYENNEAVGTAKIIITGIGDYEGTLEYTFKVIHYFEDVGATLNNVNEWYFDAVYGMVDLGAITGYNETIFGVGNSMTRAELVTVMWRYCEPDEYATYDEKNAKDTTGLPDAQNGTYYTGAVNWAYANKVITGNQHEDGTYTLNPDDPVTFEQMATILARYCLGGIEAAADYPTASLDNGAFTDKDAVEDFARGSMSWAIDNGVITGNDNYDGTWTLSPLEDVARERATTVLYRTIEGGLLKQD